MKLSGWIASFSCLFASLPSSEAVIVETERFRDLACYANEEADGEVWILLDIDDTLLIPAQMLGCDKWFEYRLKLYQQGGMDQRRALEKTLAEWEAVRHLTRMEIVEPGTEEVIRTLQEKGLRVMGLTTQGLALATRTVQQLGEQGIDLRKTAPCSSDCYVSVRGHGVLFRNGILFTSGTHKGEALLQFCDEAGIQPKRIVFINDKQSHLAEIEAAAAKRGIAFIGLRYAYSDAKKKAFCPEIAEYQFFHSSFDRILTDAEALDKLAGLEFGVLSDEGPVQARFREMDLVRQAE